jgi:hypothetical protein
LIKINVTQTVTECVEEIRRQAEDVEKDWYWQHGSTCTDESQNCTDETTCN